jgi:hypothetical protein
MLVSKAEAYPYETLSGTPVWDRFSLERLARDKHSSLVRTIVNYGSEKFNNIWTRTTPFSGCLRRRVRTTT